MHFTKKVTMIGSIIMLACCFTGCEKEVITVAGIQNPEVREDQYIVVENFELKQIEDNGKDAIACCAILIPAGYVESSTVPGMYVHSLSPLDSSNIYYTVLEGTGDGAVPDNLTSDSFEKELEDAYAKQGENVDITIEEFSRNDMEGVPGYKIRSSFEVDNKRVQQLAYIIQARDTHIITYNQLSDDELLADFEISEDEIRLVKE